MDTVRWSFLYDPATSRGGGERLVFLVGIRRSNFLLRLNTPVGRNMFLIVQMEMSFSTGFGFVPGKSYMI